MTGLGWEGWEGAVELVLGSLLQISCEVSGKGRIYQGPRLPTKSRIHTQFVGKGPYGFFTELSLKLKPKGRYKFILHRSKTIQKP